jgi:predicted thioesterase
VRERGREESAASAPLLGVLPGTQSHWRHRTTPGKVAPKRLELALQLVPTPTVIGFLINPKNPSAETVTRDLEAATTSLGLQFKVLHASTKAEIDRAVTTFRQTRAGVLVLN